MPLPPSSQGSSPGQAPGSDPSQASPADASSSTALHAAELAADNPGSPEARGCLPPLDSQALFGGGSERLIVHEGTVYRLRRTRNGKLILHK